MYRAGQKKFVQFCHNYNIIEVLPVNQELLRYFVSYLGKEGLAHSKIKNYLAAIRNLQISYGFPSPFDTPTPKLDQILRGIKITRAKQGRTPNRKLPVTPTVLRQIRSVWSGVGTDYGQTMLWAAATTCFFGFTRAGEITVKQNEKWDPSHHLSFEDVATDSRDNPTYVKLTLKTSKTDPFRKGVNVILGTTGDTLCPVRALFAYLRMRGNNPGPLFIWKNRTPLSHSRFVAHFRNALKEAGYINSEIQQYSGLSFRAGAASTAAALGVDDSLIKTLGEFSISPVSTLTTR